MQLSRSILIAGSLLAVTACSQPAPAPEVVEAAAPVDLAAVEAEVRDFIFKYNTDYANNDLDPYFRSFDPGLTQWYASGRVDLPSYEESWRKNIANGGGNTKVDVQDLVVQVSPEGDAAVATYVVEVTPRKDGQPVDRIDRNQETDVLFKKDGEWKVVHVNYRSAAQPKAGN